MPGWLLKTTKEENDFLYCVRTFLSILPQTLVVDHGQAAAATADFDEIFEMACQLSSTLTGPNCFQYNDRAFLPSFLHYWSIHQNGQAEKSMKRNLCTLPLFCWYKVDHKEGGKMLHTHSLSHTHYTTHLQKYLPI